VTVKNMTTSDQEEVVLDDLEAYLKQQAAAHA